MFENENGGNFKRVENFDHGRKHPISDGSRFGYALLNLGNRNEKGQETFAVGAPYEDDGKGAIYIYYPGNYINHIHFTRFSLFIHSPDI